MLALSRPPPRPAVLVTAVGPYSAPFTELVWALHRQRDMAVVEAYVVVDRRGLEYLQADLLDSGRGLDQLREVLPDILDHHELHLRVARTPAGQIVEDDLSFGEASCFRDTLWRTAQDAIARAGERPLVFGLTEGSRRTTCALLTSFFQLLAREQDLLIDVRVTDPRVDGDVPFFFPEQREREIHHEFSVIDVRRVEVALVELDLPRLAGVIGGEVLTTYDSAIRAAKARPSTAPPPVVIDLERGFVTIDGMEVDLSTAERFWYAYLGWRRGETTDGWVLAGQGGHTDFLAFLARARAERWASSIRTKPLRLLLQGEFVHDEDMRNLRGKTVQRLKRWCGEHRPELTRVVVPASDGHGRQRIPLPAHRIQILGLD